VSGEIIAKAVFDYEESSEYRLSVKAVNPKSSAYTSTALLTVYVRGVNEYSPKFIQVCFINCYVMILYVLVYALYITICSVYYYMLCILLYALYITICSVYYHMLCILLYVYILQKTYTFDVSESAQVGHVLGDLTATDKDEGADGQLLYILTGESNEKGFSLDITTGRLTVAEILDRESVATIVLHALVKNPGPVKGMYRYQCIILYNLLCCIILYNILYYIVLYNILYYVVLYYILYYFMLYYIIQYIILCCIIQYIILCCIILYIILFYVVLYYTIYYMVTNCSARE